jgi:hypothetical protein
MAAEFDLLIARAGLKPPADRRESLLAAYTEFRPQLRLLHGPRDALAEPSNIFIVAHHAGIEKTVR